MITRLLKLCCMLLDVKSIGTSIGQLSFSCPSAHNQPLCVAVYWFVAAVNWNLHFSHQVSQKTVGPTRMKMTTSARDDWRSFLESSERRYSFSPFWWWALDWRWAPTLTATVSSPNRLIHFVLSSYGSRATVKQQNQTRMLSHTHTQRHLAIVRSTKEELYLEYGTE